jgi:hypothetical protein
MYYTRNVSFTQLAGVSVYGGYLIYKNLNSVTIDCLIMNYDNKK